MCKLLAIISAWENCNPIYENMCYHTWVFAFMPMKVYKLLASCIWESINYIVCERYCMILLCLPFLIALIRPQLKKLSLIRQFHWHKHTTINDSHCLLRQLELLCSQANTSQLLCGQIQKPNAEEFDQTAHGESKNSNCTCKHNVQILNM